MKGNSEKTKDVIQTIRDLRKKLKIRWLQKVNV